MTEITLGSSGLVALVDDADAPAVSGVKWAARRTGRGGKTIYANGTVPPYGQVDMHRLLLGFPDEEVDHRNGDGLDNRRANLRPCTHALNLANQRPQTGRTSRYKGVRLHPRGNVWQAGIKVNGERRHLGSFSSEIEAARAYDAAALAAWGEFARLNLPAD